MSAVEFKAGSLQLHSVRLHGAADGLRARQRFEAAVAAIDSAALGLPPQTLLIIRRIAPTARLSLDPSGRRGDGAFAQSVQAELTHNAQQARRPWLHGDAAGAEAVLFADEPELMACLVRDWLRGTLAGRWWAPALLGGLPAPDWWRRNLLPRGDQLPAVLSLLADQGEAVTWVIRLSEAEVTQAIAAIIAAHAMNTLSEWLKPAPLLRGEEHSLVNAPSASLQDQQTKTHIPAPPRGSRQESITALRRLVALIPESQANTLTISQRRLLALSLGLQRASVWTRSPAFVVALQAMGTGNAGVDEDYTPNAMPNDNYWRSGVQKLVFAFRPNSNATPDDEYRQDGQTVRPDNALPLPSPRPAANHKGALDSLASHLTRDRPDRFYKPVRSNSGLFVPLTVGSREFIDSSSSRSMKLTDKPMPSVRPVEQPSGAQSEDQSGHISTQPGQAAQDAIPSGFTSEADLDAAKPLPVLLFQQSIETQFGGLFYLLNVALALGLYGDFTQPCTPGISLSPWDWLALTGRAWFGRDFEQDPVWRLLVELAGRSAKEEPGHDFLPPDSWRVPDEWLKPWDNAVELTIMVPKQPLAEQQPLAERSRSQDLSQEPGKLFASTPLSERHRSTAFLSEPKRVKVYATRKRLQIWHEAGFIVIDAARNLTMAPLAQASELCAQSEVLGAVQFVRFYKQPKKHFQPITGSIAFKRWLQWLLLYLNARLRRALGDDAPEALAKLVCCHAGRIEFTATTLDVHLSLAALPIELRIAGLDRDPGWIPAAGRSLAFHFE